MWIDSTTIGVYGKVVKTSTFKPSHEYCKGERTKYNITISDNTNTKENIFKVRCSEVELKETKLKKH